MNIHRNNRFVSSASWKMQLLFLMSADLSLGRWTLRTSPELAGQEIWPKPYGWKLHPTWLPVFSSPMATGDHGIVASVTHGRHNHLLNYRIEEKCANKHMQETTWVWRHERNRKSTVKRGIKSPLLLLQVFLYGWISGFWRSFPASMILWFCELRKYECLPRDGAKAQKVLICSQETWTHLATKKTHENIHQAKENVTFFYLRKKPRQNRRTFSKLNCWHETLAVYLSLVAPKHGVLGSVIHHHHTFHWNFCVSREVC